MDNKKPDIGVEYVDGTMEDFKDVKSASMSSNILIVVKDSCKIFLPLTNLKSYRFFNDEVLDLWNMRGETD